MRPLIPKLVTIALPIYKRLDYLPHILEILAAQDYPDIELLVSDNGMNGTRVRELVEAHYSRPYRFRQNPATVDISRHFNQLVAEAAGEYLVMLCDDDEISSNYVSELVGSLERHPEAAVALARQEMFNKDGTIVRKSNENMPDALSGTDFIAATWHDYAFGMEMVGTFLVRTEKLRACGGYPDFCRGTGIDNALLVKLILNSGIALNSRCAFRWRLDDVSYGWSVSAAELALACREFLDFLETDPIIRNYALAHPDQWQQSKQQLVRMTWVTYFGRWNNIYRERLPWLPWVRAAFAMPWIADYYQQVASMLIHSSKASIKSRLKRVFTETRSQTTTCSPLGARGNGAPLKIVHVNTFDQMGGAARSANRLHQGLRALGEDSKMFVRWAQSNHPSVIEMRPSRHLFDRIRRRIRQRGIARDFQNYRFTRPNGYEQFQDCRSQFRCDFLRELPACDILNLHWVADSFLDYESFFASVPKTTRIVWTLHDMNAFTGGCHYDVGCGRFAVCCGGCPQLGSNEERDLAYRIWQRKAKAFSQLDSSRLQFVSPSRWLAEELGKSPLTARFPVSVIPYGLDLNDFAPRNRAVCREILGLPIDATVLLFVADGLDNERKGFALLVAALAALPRDVPIAILSVGRNQPNVEVHAPWIHVGAVTNDRHLSVLYSAADIFVIPSLQDNLPNTVLESMACGTPVLGFAVGGIPDMVRPGITGMLVPPADVDALGVAMVQLLHDPGHLQEMGLNCRRIATAEYSLDLQASRYAKLYATMRNASN